MPGSLPHLLRPRRAVALLLFALAAATGFARIGETLDLLTKRFGKGPERDSPKHMAVWFIESIDGALVYTVTLNAKGVSIAEGIKPLKRAQLTEKIATDFLQDQMTLLKDSKTARQVKPGEKYAFAGQSFTCGEGEYVVLDEERGLLLVWSRAGVPSVMAITREMLAHPPE
ncbi:MAG TPA: hypothetical protein VHD61_13765 [Lacunisphaera sp.]|nr:hypothetical protein [Lacunisphaera sp.]